MKLNWLSKHAPVMALAYLLGTVSAQAALFSGAPVADGWTYQGNSVTLGDSYVRGAGAINFDIYSTLLTVTSGLLTECGTACSTWQVGDVVLGMAAQFSGNGNQQSSPGTLPGVIMKWGTSASTYSLSSIASPSGNGSGSHSGSGGGTGSVLARLNAPGADGIYGPSLSAQKTALAGDGPALPAGVVVFHALTNGELFISVEGLLNVTRLNALDPNSLGPLTYGGNSIVAVQRGMGNSTDGLVDSFAANSGEVPEPSTGLLAGGALAAAWALRRKQRN